KQKIQERLNPSRPFALFVDDRIRRHGGRMVEGQRTLDLPSLGRVGTMGAVAPSPSMVSHRSERTKSTAVP
ncbi:MAG: hypothetical protein C0183_21735, partial [Roseiflexus castenholzii]